MNVIFGHLAVHCSYSNRSTCGDKCDYAKDNSEGECIFNHDMECSNEEVQRELISREGL